MTTLYLSMSANEKDLEIEDDLAKGIFITKLTASRRQSNILSSSEDLARLEVKDLFPIQEEFCFGEGCQVSGFQNRSSDSKSDGIGRGAPGFELFPTYG